MPENDSKSRLLVPHQPRPYDRFTDEQLDKLARDVRDKKVFSTEDAFTKFGPQGGSQLLPLIFPAIGQAMAVTNAKKEGALDIFLAGQDQDTVKFLVADAEGIMKELGQNDPLMFFNYFSEQVSAAHRAKMNLPPEMSEIPIFGGFMYLNSEDYNRFCKVRQQMMVEQMEGGGSLPS